MHRLLEELSVDLHFAPFQQDADPGVVPFQEDVYREDPYRFDTPGDAASLTKLAASDDLRRIDYLPTPTEIAGSCAEIRRGWTMSEKRRRFVGELPAEAVDDTAWAPPVIDTSHFRVSSQSVGDGV